MELHSILPSFSTNENKTATIAYTYYEKYGK